MKRIIVGCCQGSYVTALTENSKLIELIRDDKKNASIVGNIYAGVVKNINTGFVFLDIGIQKLAFLDTRDHREKGLVAKQGDILIVQILRDGAGDKGPTATSNISLVGRFVVLSQSIEQHKISVSRKIGSETEANRLTTIGKTHVPPGISAIMRSAAAGRCQSEIVAEISQIVSKLDRQAEWHLVKGPATLFAEPPICKTLREVVTDDIDEIVFGDGLSIFEEYFLTTQIDKMRDKRVWLKSGAFIVIEQTEACVVIDVNSGKLTGKKDSGLKVNMESAREIAYQLRLRNLSGIIIVDFIAMKSKEDIDSLTEFLRAEVAKDRIPAVVVGMTTLGLMEITRKRTRR